MQGQGPRNSRPLAYIVLCPGPSPKFKRGSGKDTSVSTGLQLPSPTQHLKTLVDPKKKTSKPRHLGRDYEIWHAGIREEKNYPERQTKGNFKDRVPQI